LGSHQKHFERFARERPLLIQQIAVAHYIVPEYRRNKERQPSTVGCSRRPEGGNRVFFATPYESWQNNDESGPSMLFYVCCGQFLTQRVHFPPVESNRFFQRREIVHVRFAGLADDK
jgi:hypothetical protein